MTSISSQNLDRFDKGKEPLAGLDESNQLMSSLLSDLNTPIGSPRPSIDDECYDDDEDENNFRRYTESPVGFDRASFGTSRRRRATENLAQISEESGRLSSSSLSHSQPDLTLNSIKVHPSLSQCTLDDSQDELTSSLPASTVQPYAEQDKLSMSLSFSKPRAVDLAVSGRFNKGKLGKREDKKSKKTRDSAKNSDSLDAPPMASLYFPAGQTPTKQSSPSRFSNLFRRKSKDIKRPSPKASPRGSLDYTDYDNPAAKKGQQRRVTVPHTSKHAPTYMNLTPLNGPKSAGGRLTDRQSPLRTLPVRRQSSLTVRNIHRAEKIFTVLNEWIRSHPEVGAWWISF